ncbi:MAG TPA: GT4 family glycosyltransferase PelF [Pirellulaceae bacterium]|nr:GT4 family glycosyltransferase PelF [Pirellulaceae bacterium]
MIARRSSIPAADGRQTALAHKPVICQLVHTLNVGGAELLARQFAEAARDRYRFVFVCLDAPGVMAEELAAQGYAIEVIGRKAGFDLACAWRLGRVLRRHGVELVHAHQYAPFFYAMLARMMGMRHLPIIFTEHGRDYPDYPRLKRKVANRLLLRRCDRVVAVGNCVRDALIQNEGLPPDRVEVIYNGVDISRYDPQRPLRDAVRKELGYDQGEILIMQVARLNRLKDHPTALRAMARLAKDCPQARLVLVGDGEERPALEKLTDELGLRGVVRFLGTRSDVARLLQAADIFLLSSISEGIPLTIIEAMATGLPCVATDVGGIAEVIIDGETGRLADARDADALADRLRALIGEPERARRMGAAGCIRAEGHFSDAAMHASYGKIYGELLNQNGLTQAAAGQCREVPA